MTLEEGIALATGAIKAVATPILNWMESEKEIGRIGSETDTDEKTYYGRLNQSVSQAKLELNNQYDQNRKLLNSNIGIVSERRAFGSNLASQTNVKNNQFMYEDLSMMMDQMAAAEGQAMQRASLTGFRNTGSQELGLNELERENQYQIDRAMETIKLSSAQSYAMASENYYSATAQIEQYRQNLRDAETNYNTAMSRIDMEYEQDKQALKEAKEDAQYTFWEGLLDFVTLGLAATQDYLSASEAEELSTIQKDFYTEQTEYYKEQRGAGSSVRIQPGTTIKSPTYMKQ